MGLTAEQVDSLNIAFNEATLLGAELDAERCLAGLTLSLLTLPEVVLRVTSIKPRASHGLYVTSC